MKNCIFFSFLVSILFFKNITLFSNTQALFISKHLSFNMDTIHYPEEKHFKNVQQLTFGGDNAEAYFSFDGQWLIFQKTNAAEGIGCDQMYIGKIPTKQGEKFEPKLVSTGKGRTTCGAFTGDGKHVIYASTHLEKEECPAVPDRKKYGNKYIWPLYSSFDIFMADLHGKIVKKNYYFKRIRCGSHFITRWKKMVYTSTKDGDIELYIMDMITGSEKE